MSVVEFTTEQDKRQAIIAALRADYTRTNVDIARAVGCYRRTVANIRLQLEEAKDIPISPLAYSRKSRAGTLPATIERIARLARQGFNADQIAEQTELSVKTVRRYAIEHGVDIPRAASHRPAISADRVIEESVHTLAGIAQGLQLIEGRPLTVTPEHAGALLNDTYKALRVIKRMTKVLLDRRSGNG